MKSPVCFGVFWGSNSCDRYLRKKKAEPRKTLAKWPTLFFIKGTFNLMVLLPGDPRGVRCSHFWSEFCPAISGFVR
jgi:hypothetical protein